MHVKNETRSRHANKLPISTYAPAQGDLLRSLLGLAAVASGPASGPLLEAAAARACSAQLRRAARLVLVQVAFFWCSEPLLGRLQTEPHASALLQARSQPAVQGGSIKRRGWVQHAQ